MKILFIRNAGRFSGSETYNINLFQELTLGSVNKVYLLTNLELLARKSSELNVKSFVIRWGKEGVGTKSRLFFTVLSLPFIIPFYLFKIRLLEENGKLDVICLQSMTEKIFLTPILKAFRYKIVWTELGPIYATRMSGVIKFLYRIASIFTDRIITISNDTKRDLQNGGLPNRKLKTVYIGINTKVFRPLTKKEINKTKLKLGIPQGKFIIGFLGTVTVEKGIDYFVDLSLKLSNNEENYYFIVIGDGPDYKKMKKTVTAFKILNRYKMTGFLENVRRHLGCIDLLFLPTEHYEGLPLAILEAQAMGKIVITSNMGGNSEIIRSGLNGYIYNTLYIDEVADLVAILYEDKALQRRLEKSARENILRRFNITEQANRFVEELKTL